MDIPPPPESAVEGMESVLSVCVCVCASVSALMVELFDDFWARILTKRGHVSLILSIH